MIRPFTCLCLAAACGSGLYLYTEKHHTVLLDRQISSVINQTQAARARIGMLRAEWALLNEPGRLQDMADKYLALKPMAPTQFVQLDDLPAHLPPPETADEAASAQAQEESDSAAATPPTADTSPPVADTNPDVILPKRVLEPKPAPRLLARLDVKAKPHHVGVVDSGTTQPGDAMARGTMLPLAAPQPRAHVFSAMAHPMLANAYHPQIVAASPRYTPPYVGSALGGSGSLPPPTPYGGAP